ncbi:MAG TPA: PAS domain S-box protein [Anaerolineaceae bacterium]
MDQGNIHKNSFREENLKSTFSRTIFGEPNQIASLRQLRERLLNVLLSSTVIFGAALYAIYLIPALKNGLSGISIAYTILFIWLLVILFIHRIPYLVRTVSWVTILYALGTIYTIQQGLGIQAGLLFLAFVIMTTLLVGMRFGLAAFLVNIVIIATLAVLSVIGAIHPEVELFSGAPLYWIEGGIIFLLIGIILVISTNLLMRTLEDGLIKATSLAGKLEESNAALRANEERYRAIVEDSVDIISILSIDGTIQYINPSPERILGYKMEELKGRKIFDFLHPDDINLVAAALTPGVPAEEIGPSLELRVCHKDGSWRTLEVRGNEMHTNPTVNGTIIICRDITERKEIEKELKESHRLLKMIYASLNDAVFILDARTAIILDCNPAASEIFGYSREELLGLTTNFLHCNPAALEEYQKHLYPAIDEIGFLRNFEFQMKRKDGTIFPTEHSVVPLQDPQAGRIGWVSVVHDITERKRLETQLQKANEGLEFQVATKTRELQERQQIQRAMLEATDQSIILLDLKGIILTANETAAKRMNRDLNDFVGFCVWDLLPPELGKSRKAVVNKVVKTRKPIMIEDEREGIALESNLFPIYDHEGQVVQIALFVRDITTQKNTEIALQESEELYRTLAEAAHDMIYVTGEDDLILYANSYAAGQFDLAPEDLIGKPLSSLFPDSIAKRQKEAMLATLETGSPSYSESWINFGKEELAYVSTWLVPLNDQINGKRSVLGVSRDITALRMMQEELKLSHDQLEKRVEQRTKELVDLSAGMRLLAQKIITAQEEERRRISRELHDDTGQVLVTLKYSLAELLKELPSDHDILHKRVAEGIKEVDEAMAGIRAIAHSLRPPLLDAGGLNISLKDFCKDINHRTKIQVNYSGVELDNLPDEIAVTLFRVVQESFSNILKHSRAKSVNVILQFIRGRIILSVSDNGVGIRDSQETTGIGLIGIRERVGYLGGKLQVKASRGKGTIIKVSIPWKSHVNAA